MIGLKDTTTGDTLCDQASPIVLESMSFPAPVIQVSIEPKTKSDQEKLGVAIQKLAEEDPTFSVELDEETGQTVIGGMGELHLDILVDRMRREFKVEANVGKPQVAYRETITKKVEKHDYTHKKQTGGSGQFAKVIIALEPFVGEDGATYEFENKVSGGRIPREYIPSVDAGAQDAMQYGVLAGYPLVNLKLSLLDGAYHDVDSSEMAFKVAGSQALCFSSGTLLLISSSTWSKPPLLNRSSRRSITTAICSTSSGFSLRSPCSDSSAVFLEIRSISA